MLHLPIPDVIEKIQSETGLAKDAIKEKIIEKMRTLDGLVSEEGAAYIVASELGVHLFREQSSSAGSVKIGTILAGMMSVETVGKVTRVFPAKEFTTKEGKKGKVGSLVIADGTGTIRVALWDKKADVLERITSGTIVKIIGAYAKLNRSNEAELHVSTKGTLVLDPKGVSIDISSSTSDAPLKKISALNPGETATLRGTIVSAFSPKLYPVCSKCGKKVITAPEGWICSEHKAVTSNQAMLLSVVLDDGTDTLRLVSFKETAEKLCSLQTKDVQDILAKDGPAILQEKVDDFLLGRTIEVSGRAKQNITTEQIEFMVSNVNLSLDPVKIANELLKGAKNDAKP